jgi:hypothetical protein
MVQLLAGFQLSQALYAVAALGIADLLREGGFHVPGSDGDSTPVSVIKALA